MELEPLFVGGDLPRDSKERDASWTRSGGTVGQAAVTDDENYDEDEAQRDKNIRDICHPSKLETRMLETV